jgi:hypothetical protein
MSRLGLLEGDAATALEYSRAAGAADGTRRWTVALTKFHEARGYAMLGDHHGFERQAGEAQRAVERLDDHDRAEAPWLFGAEGEALVASHLAGALRDLASTTGIHRIAGRAVAYAETSLANIPAWMDRTRLMLTLRLADSHACRSDFEAAVAVARPVMATAASARTSLVEQQLGRLRARLGYRLSESLDSC